jgi:tetratricopeptide (TPR) repeat protein
MISPEKEKVLRHFAEGRKHYKMMDFSGALEHFTQALSIDPEDGPSKVYQARCKHYIENPPAEDWDGVFVMQTK